MACPPLKYTCTPMISTCFLKTFTESLYVWDNYMGLLLMIRYTLVLLVDTVMIDAISRTGLVEVLEFPSVYCPFKALPFL